MSTNTARLLLQKPDPDPVTGDFLDVSVLNSNFDKLDAAMGAEPVTSSTRPTGSARFHGKFIRETDTGQIRIWDGSNWLWVPNVNAAGTHIILSGAEMNLTRAAATDTIYYGQVTGDSVGRFLVRADGRIEMGPGSSGRDVNLYRGGANLLKTDVNFEAPGYRIAGTSVGQAWVMTYSADVALASAQVVPVALTDVTGCSLTFTTRKDNAVLKAYYSFDFLTTASSAGTAVGRVWIAGTSYGDSQAIFNGGNTTAGTRATVANSKRVVLGVAGSYTVKLQMNNGAGTGVTAQAAHTKLMVEVFE